MICVLACQISQSVALVIAKADCRIDRRSTQSRCCSGYESQENAPSDNEDKGGWVSWLNTVEKRSDESPGPHRRYRAYRCASSRDGKNSNQNASENVHALSSQRPSHTELPAPFLDQNSEDAVHAENRQQEGRSGKSD
jgi:hypothetical protein